MSWIFFTTRWKINLTERLDSREHQNWTRIGSHNQLPARWKFELNLWTKTNLTRGSEFLMAWTNWSQTWSTKSTTTTSKTPLQRRRKYLLLQGDQRLKQNREDLPLTTCSSSRTVHILERKWVHIEPGAQFDQAYPMAKRINTLLRHGELPREEDGAIEFWRLKDDLLNKFGYSQYWSDEVWKSKMAGGGGNKKKNQYCTEQSRQEILYLRALQGHSGRNPIDPTLQDTVLIPNNFFEYIYHIGCAFNLHSITNSGLIAGGKNSSKDRQTVFFTAVNPMRKDHKDPQELDLTKPRLPSYKQKWKRHQVRCTGSIYSLLKGKDWSSIKQDRTQSSSTIHSQLIVYRK